MNDDNKAQYHQNALFYSYQIDATLIALTFTVTIFAAILFHKRRRYFPLNKRDPAAIWFLLISQMLALIASGQPTRVGLVNANSIDKNGFPYNTWLGYLGSLSGTVYGVAHCFHFLRIYYLAKIESTKEKLELNATAEQIQAAVKQRKIVESRNLYKFAGASFVLCLIGLVIPRLFSNANEESTAFALNMIINIIPIVVLSVVLWKLRNYKDNRGGFQLEIYAAMVFIPLVFTMAALKLVWLFIVIPTSYFLYVGMLYPTYLTYDFENKRRLSAQAPAIKDFKPENLDQYLQDPKFYGEFLEFVKREYCSELLYYIQEVSKLNDHSSVRDIHYINNNYIRSGSVLEINISQKARKKIYGLIQEKLGTQLSHVGSDHSKLGNEEEKHEFVDELSWEEIFAHSRQEAIRLLIEGPALRYKRYLRAHGRDNESQFGSSINL